MSSPFEETYFSDHNCNGKNKMVLFPEGWTGAVGHKGQLVLGRGHVAGERPWQGSWVSWGAAQRVRDRDG